jgi:hypothetical protein
MFKASLIIGGTGMLAQASRWLAARSDGRSRNVGAV